MHTWVAPAYQTDIGRISIHTRETEVHEQYEAGADSANSRY